MYNLWKNKRTQKNFARFARAPPLHRLFMSDPPPPPLTKFLHPPLQGNGSSFSSEWETFFTEVARVVASANNQRGLANEEFSQYVVEQLEMIIISVSTLNSYLGSHLPSSELGSEIAISNMCEELSSLLECLRCILGYSII